MKIGAAIALLCTITTGYAHAAGELSYHITSPHLGNLISASECQMWAGVMTYSWTFSVTYTTVTDPTRNIGNMTPSEYYQGTPYISWMTTSNFLQPPHLAAIPASGGTPTAGLFFCGAKNVTYPGLPNEMGPLGDAFASANGSQVTFTGTDNFIGGKFCIGHITDNGIYDFEYGQLGTECASLPSPNLHCEATNSVDIKYKEMPVGAANGAVETSNISLSCSDSSNVQVSLQNSADDTIQLSNGMKAKIEINSKRLGSISVPPGVTLLNLSSTLEGTPSRAGSFEGSDVLIFNYN
jgi:hypothetical protein